MRTLRSGQSRWRIGRQFGPFDAAFLPINGARFGWRKPVSGQPGVLTPEQAVAAATILGARQLIPIHYGISGLAEYVEVDDPIGRLRKAAQEKSLAIQPLAPGEWVGFRKTAFRGMMGMTRQPSSESKDVR